MTASLPELQPLLSGTRPSINVNVSNTVRPFPSNGLIVREQYSSTGFRWVDVYGMPSWGSPGMRHLIEDLATEYSMHPAHVKDCFAPNHLPKVEHIGQITVFILRYADADAPPGADAITQLSRKLLLIVCEDRLVTIHRRRLEKRVFPNVHELYEDWDASITIDHVINVFLDDVIGTYRLSLSSEERDVDGFEEGLHSSARRARGHTHYMEQLYQLRRQVGVQRRLIRMTHEVIQRYIRIADVAFPAESPHSRSPHSTPPRSPSEGTTVGESCSDVPPKRRPRVTSEATLAPPSTEFHQQLSNTSADSDATHGDGYPYFLRSNATTGYRRGRHRNMGLRTMKSRRDPYREDLRDDMDAVVFQVENLHENISDLLSLYMSFVEHRTNRLLYILTLVTVVFIPLSFMVGYYGMNWEFMPELHFKYSYYVFIGLCGFSVAFTLGCLKYRRFI